MGLQINVNNLLQRPLPELAFNDEMCFNSACKAWIKLSHRYSTFLDISNYHNNLKDFKNHQDI